MQLSQQKLKTISKFQLYLQDFQFSYALVIFQLNEKALKCKNYIFFHLKTFIIVNCMFLLYQDKIWSKFAKYSKFPHVSYIYESLKLKKLKNEVKFE